MLEALDHQEMNGQVEVTQIMLRTISHSLMLHTRVLEAYINFSIMYMKDNIYGTTNQRTDEQRRQADHTI